MKVSCCWSSWPCTNPTAVPFVLGSRISPAGMPPRARGCPRNFASNAPALLRQLRDMRHEPQLAAGYCGEEAKRDPHGEERGGISCPPPRTRSRAESALHLALCTRTEMVMVIGKMRLLLFRREP